MTELTGITRAAAPVAFPQDRGCPYEPPAAYAALRDGPALSRVALYDGREVWLVTGHGAARALLADQRLSSDRCRPGFPQLSARLAAIQSDRSPALFGTDDPEHQVQRRMMIPSFSLRSVNAQRPRIQRTVDTLLEAMIAQGPPAELVSAFALPVSLTMICGLLGVPYADHAFFTAQCHRMLSGPTGADARDARGRLDEYLGDLIDRKERQSAPGEGLLDDLVRDQLRAGTLERAELVSLALLMLVAGHETTAGMISLGTLTLLAHPERLAELRADAALWPAAVEELMRMLSISDGLARLALEDIEVAGVTIRAGEGVLFALSVINRDASVYDAPDAPDWHRPARHHLGFGFGIHQCLGQNLARAELEIALSSLFARLPALRPAVPVQEIPFKPGDTTQGLLELPVTW
ncbi:cytochrome P450 [Streptomyces asoensis]|uniref:Cytochrome P450 n=1 Tax=Streptomyces asoensis TaxID=249586 RepID=A0A6M4WRR1_9ACTN|nr:cytochrome P450 [Streptomyces asoensis]QJS98972.1 cytochrome P450 [Streptomyces asoensis]QJT06497.1 cytochrome P450 [Streptomyces asoensis]